jgi:hypothetical protein
LCQQFVSLKSVVTEEQYIPLMKALFALQCQWIISDQLASGDWGLGVNWGINAA